jgi:hypothetical protein
MGTAGEQPALTQSLFALQALAALPPVQAQLSASPTVVTALLRLMRTTPAARCSAAAAAATRARQLTAATLLARMCEAPHTAAALLLRGGQPAVTRRAASSDASTASSGALYCSRPSTVAWLHPFHLRAAALCRVRVGRLRLASEKDFVCSACMMVFQPTRSLPKCTFAEGERASGGEAAVGDTLARTLSTFLALHWDDDDDDDDSHHDADCTGDAEPPPPRAWLREAQAAAAAVVAAAVRATLSAPTLRVPPRFSSLASGRSKAEADGDIADGSILTATSVRRTMHVWLHSLGNEDC